MWVWNRYPYSIYRKQINLITKIMVVSSWWLLFFNAPCNLLTPILSKVCSLTYLNSPHRENSIFSVIKCSAKWRWRKSSWRSPRLWRINFSTICVGLAEQTGFYRQNSINLFTYITICAVKFSQSWWLHQSYRPFTRNTALQV
jgi:hypothetical protein